jgi:hypothetical protein
MENLRFRGRLMVFEQTLGREPCWIYPGKPQSNGYCTVYVRYDDGSQHHILAHKLAYLFLRGSYPETSEIDGRVYQTELDHLCRTPRCCNPWHLEPVPQIENWRRGNSLSAQRARQTHCKNGHPLSGDNLIVGTNSKNGRPYRKCRVCNNAWYRTRRITHPDEARVRDRGRKRRWDTRRNHPRIPPIACPQGHPYSGDNLFFVVDKYGRHRRCRICERKKCRDRYHRKMLPHTT